jgi:hypothetical protein
MLALGARLRAVFLVALLAAASVALVGGDVLGLSAGISETADKGAGATVTLLEGGCSCHNPTYTGQVTAVLEGVPAFYTDVKGAAVLPGPYNLTIRILGGPPAQPGKHQGGFNLQVTGGTLQVAQGATGVQILDGQATHTSAGNQQRNWTGVQWAPPSAPSGDVVFTLTVNSVNGDNANSPDDLWGRTTAVSMGKPGTHLAMAAAGGAAGGGSAVEAISKLGVSYYAYWVGVVSFVALFIVVAVTFFILRYGESRHWTDWRDRPAPKLKEGEAPPKTPVGTYIVLALMVVVFLVAAVQVAKVV